MAGFGGGRDNDSKSFLKMVFDRDEKARKEQGLSRSEMAKQREYINAIADATKKIVAKDARDQQRLNKLIKTLETKGGSAGSYESALVDSIERLNKEIAAKSDTTKNTAAIQQKQKEIARYKRTQNLGGATGAAAAEKEKKATEELAELMFSTQVQALKEQKATAERLIKEFKENQERESEKSRRSELGFRGRLLEDTVALLDTQTAKTLGNLMKGGGEFLKGVVVGFGKEFWNGVGGKALTGFVKDSAKKMGDALKKAFNDSPLGKGLKKFTEGFKDYKDKFFAWTRRSEFLEKMKAKGTAAGGLLAKGAGIAALAAIVGTIGYKIGEWINDQITEFLGMPLGEWWFHKWEGIKKTFSDMIDSVAGFFTDTGKLLTGMYDGVTGFFSNIGTGISTIADDFSKWWEQFSLVDMITGAFSSIGNMITEKLDGMGKKVAGFLGLDWGGVKAAVGAVASAPGKLGSAIGTSLHGGVSKVKDFFSGGNEHQQALIAQMDKAGIKDPKERAMFMAQMAHESGGFKSTEESFKYRSADQLMATSAQARGMGRDKVEAALKGGPESTAEIMYGGRMGNDKPGDAYKYRGRGVIQLTGKENYAKAGKALGLDLVKNPDMAEQPTIAAQIATWYWKDKNIGEKARAGDIVGVTKAINGGTIGLADRNAEYQAALAQSGGATTAVQASSMASTTTPTQAMPAVAMQQGGGGTTVINKSSSPTPQAPTSTPNIDEIPMFVADTGIMVTTAVGAMT